MDKAEKDVFLYKQWKKTGEKQDFQNLYRHMLPSIASASEKASRNSPVPKSVFKLVAAQQFYNDVNNFDPTVGVKLSTYTYGNIEKKLNRVNSSYQNISRIVERRKGTGGVFDINVINNAEYILQDKLGRKPTDVEIAQEVGFTPQNVGRLREENRKDLSLNAELDDMITSGDEDIMKETLYMIYYDLPPEAQLVFDLANGMHGKKKVVKPNGATDWKRIATQLGMSDSKVQKLRKMIGKELSRYNM